MTSPNFPSDYRDRDDCTIMMDPPSPIEVEAFSTEADFDKLWVDGTPYSGSDGPVGIVPNGPVQWSSDESVPSQRGV